MDEMKITSNLIFDKQTWELKGYLDLGSVDMDFSTMGTVWPTLRLMKIGEAVTILEFNVQKPWNQLGKRRNDLSGWCGSVTPGRIKKMKQHPVSGDWRRFDTVRVKSIKAVIKWKNVLTDEICTFTGNQ